MARVLFLIVCISSYMKTTADSKGVWWITTLFPIGYTLKYPRPEKSIEERRMLLRSAIKELTFIYGDNLEVSRSRGRGGWRSQGEDWILPNRQSRFVYLCLLWMTCDLFPADAQTYEYGEDLGVTAVALYDYQAGEWSQALYNLYLNHIYQNSIF